MFLIIMLFVAIFFGVFSLHGIIGDFINMHYRNLRGQTYSIHTANIFWLASSIFYIVWYLFLH